MEKEAGAASTEEIPNLAKRERKHSNEGVEIEVKNGLSTQEVSVYYVR